MILECGRSKIFARSDAPAELHVLLVFIIVSSFAFVVFCCVLQAPPVLGLRSWVETIRMGTTTVVTHKPRDVRCRHAQCNFCLDPTPGMGVPPPGGGGPPPGGGGPPPGGGGPPDFGGIWKSALLEYPQKVATRKKNEGV